MGNSPFTRGPSCRSRKRSRTRLTGGTPLIPSRIPERHGNGTWGDATGPTRRFAAPVVALRRSPARRAASAARRWRAPGSAGGGVPNRCRRVREVPRGFRTRPVRRCAGRESYRHHGSWTGGGRLRSTCGPASGCGCRVGSSVRFRNRRNSSPRREPGSRHREQAHGRRTGAGARRSRSCFRVHALRSGSHAASAR